MIKYKSTAVLKREAMPLFKHKETMGNLGNNLCLKNGTMATYLKINKHEFV